MGDILLMVSREDGNTLHRNYAGTIFSYNHYLHTHQKCVENSLFVGFVQLFSTWVSGIGDCSYFEGIQSPVSQKPQ